MIVRSLNDDAQINGALNSAMVATIKSLVEEGYITSEKGNDYLGNHIAVMVTKDSMWDRLLKWMGRELSDSSFFVEILKSTSPKHISLEK